MFRSETFAPRSDALGTALVLAAMLFPLAATAALTKDAGYYQNVTNSLDWEETEPSIAINPADSSKIVIAFMRDKQNGQANRCWTRTSLDGGSTWQPEVNVETNNWPCVDVSLAYNASGSKLRLSRLEVQPGLVWTIDYVRESSDNGLTWTTETVVNDSNDASGPVTDRPWIAPNWGPTNPGYFLSSMTQYNQLNPLHIYMRRYGAAPSLVVVDTAAGAAAGKCVSWQTISGHGDNAYMAWRSKRTDCLNDGDDDDGCFSAARSSDAGANWFSSPIPIADLDFVEYGYGGYQSEEGCTGTGTILGGATWEDTYPYPVIAANPADPLKAVTVWLDARFSGGAKDSDVVLTRTDDGGQSWITPARVNKDTEGNGVFQDRPWAAYNKEGTRLFVIWRDRRKSTPATGLGVNSDLFVACSTDHGQTWVASTGSGSNGKNLRLSANGHKTATHSQQDGFNGVAGAGDTGVAVWSTYQNSSDAYRDLYFAKFTCN